MNVINVKKRINLYNPCHFLATGFGSGMFPWMPGTIGSLVAIPSWYLLVLLPWHLYFLAVLFSFFLGVYFCHQTAQDMRIHDHCCIVWDEFVGLWITLIALPVNDWRWVLSGFFLFRLLDTWKPWPICWFDRKVYGGIGIMLDDVIAGGIAAILLYSIGYLLNNRGAFFTSVIF
ncbi:phosphatidylglycerophosphatase A [secondary endosymbiont of Ctenarytaina eucalypti]|uniref:Phosphatidylglycerophosphatase A n=1 Tax=secondary endosymbiont of Ctenarytaina eucalypti TaxID=1199245 RepID=J3VR68_9ENTR|nr:phosphatidylglycerophosphatase A [secondary endosymbiont of Ctenarytaina eucalypti]AFP84431.1 phosphatidylglycerophosphatase A-like protein [secondary endosymbiont of Ctenarytaina eucalypti]